MRFHKGNDGWGRGSYEIPTYAVVGSSYCGNHSDSPAKEEDVHKELNDFRKVLKANKIRSRLKHTQSGNIFMVKIWVVVPKNNFEAAADLALKYLEEHKDDTHLIHDADLAVAK